MAQKPKDAEPRAERIRRSQRTDRFPNLRRLGLSLGIDPAKLNSALAYAEALLTEDEKAKK